MSTRPHIIKSKNTRYGIDHDENFRTIYTSKGIKEIISSGASYFNSLDSNTASDQTQRLIRPKFLQMVVLLLLLLNDDDLRDIKDFLESTYQLKAERAHLEMTFLKVIPLMSINSKVFLEALIRTIDGEKFNPFRRESAENLGDIDSRLSEWWDSFVQLRLTQGYLIPGGLESLGRLERSWSTKWPQHEGVKSSEIFKDLQYAVPGCSLRVINELQQVDLHPEASLDVVSIQLSNGSKFKVHPANVEQITLLVPGQYAITEALTNGRTYDLVVKERNVNNGIIEAFKHVNDMIDWYHKLLDLPREKKSWNKIFNKDGKGKESQYLDRVKGSGPITQNEAFLGGHILASVYKLAGRKINHHDVLYNLQSALQRLQIAIGNIETKIVPYLASESSEIRAHVKKGIDHLKTQYEQTYRLRSDISTQEPFADDPIVKISYPNRFNPNQQPIWFDYSAWYTQGLLTIESKKTTVMEVRWQSPEVLDIVLDQHPNTYSATPLGRVQEDQRSDEVRSGDTVLLVGQYIIIANIPDDAPPVYVDGRPLYLDGNPLYVMENYLRIVSVEAQKVSRRGANRAYGRTENVVTYFR